MTPENFAYWLQGAMEIHGPGPWSVEQVQTVANHLNLVFTHIDFQVPAEQQEALNAAHNGTSKWKGSGLSGPLGKDAGSQFPGGKIPKHLDASVPDSEFPNGRPRC